MCKREKEREVRDWETDIIEPKSHIFQRTMEMESKRIERIEKGKEKEKERLEIGHFIISLMTKLSQREFVTIYGMLLFVREMILGMRLFDVCFGSVTYCSSNI